MREALVAGLDEVGWGAPAGPIVSVVVVSTESRLSSLPQGVTDSKKMSEALREALFDQILSCAIDVGLGSVEPAEIDAMGPKFALQESYRRALTGLRWAPDCLIVDGSDGMNKVRCWNGQQIVEPKADYKYKQVSMASIVAKVIRDRVMRERARRMRSQNLPDYGWEVNKGYLTQDHRQAIEEHGLLFGPMIYEHRRSYCSNLLGKVKVNGY